MRITLTEQRKEALIENASKLHGRKSLDAPRPKGSRADVWGLCVAMTVLGLFVLWAFNA